MINQKEIAILIPSFGRKKLLEIAINSALKTAVEEIIVSEDASGECISTIEKIKDKRIKIIYQKQNLGLWKNHLKLIQYTDKKWIKFLQTDDYLLPECLSKMCSMVGKNTTLISALPIYKDLYSKKYEFRYRLSRPLRFKDGNYIDRMIKFGNEPGRPSYNLYRRDALIENESAWKNSMSCDLVANVIAASKGEVILLPPGCVVCGMHKERDGAKQTLEILATRLQNSIAYLNSFENNKIKKFVSIYGTVELLNIIRIFFKKNKKENNLNLKEFLIINKNIIKNIDLKMSFKNLYSIYSYFKYKYYIYNKKC